MANLSNINNKFLVTTGGNVLIGQTSAVGSSILQVASSQTNSSIKTGGLEMQSYAVNNSWYAENLYYDGVWRLRSDGYATQMYMEVGTISFKRVASGSAGANVSPLTTMVLHSSGNVGIGSLNPYAFDTTATKLHVKNPGSSGSVVEVARFEGSPDASGSGGTIRLGTSNDRGIYFEGGRTATVPYGKIGLTEYNGAKTPIISLFHDSATNFSGNVTANGIYTAGNSAIIYKAQRNGGAVAGDWSYDDATTDMSLGTSTAHSFSLKTGGTRALTINSSGDATFAGKLGIGGSPTFKLDVLSDGSSLRLNSSDANGSYLTWSNNGTANGFIGSGYHLWSSPNNIATSLGIRAQTRLDLGVGASVHMTILSSGNVGIGTTSPGTYKLNVVGTALFSGAVEMAGGAAVYQGQKFWLDGGGDTFLESPSSNLMTFTTNGTERMRIDGSGNVNISNNSSYTRINVNNTKGSAGGTSAIQFGLSDGSFVTTDAARIESRIIANPNAAMDFKVYGSGLNTIMSLLGNGNVDIGNNGAGARNARLLLNNAGSQGAPQLMLVDSGDSGKQSEIRFDSGNLIFDYWGGTSRSERMRIDSSGNVGIGTASPGDAKLYVNGGTTLGGTNNNSAGAIRMFGDRKLPQANNFVKRNYTLQAGASGALYSIARQWHDHANWGLGNINVIMWGVSYGHNNFGKADFSCKYGYSGGTASVQANFNPGGLAVPSWTAATQVSGNIYYRDLQIQIPAYLQISFEIISPGLAQTYNLSNTAQNTVYLYPH